VTQNGVFPLYWDILDRAWSSCGGFHASRCTPCESCGGIGSQRVFLGVLYFCGIAALARCTREGFRRRGGATPRCAPSGLSLRLRARLSAALKSFRPASGLLPMRQKLLAVIGDVKTCTVCRRSGATGITVCARPQSDRCQPLLSRSSSARTAMTRSSLGAVLPDRQIWLYRLGL